MINQILNPARKNAILIILIGLYILTLIAVSTNINDAYLWFDEAGQFWISKGLNHDSAPLQETKELSVTIENNANYNMDPGGFSILLHFWTGISNSTNWLRLLPFIFFIGTIFSFIYISYLWTKNINIALFLGFLPFLFGNVVAMGFEVRGYSMEYFGVIFAIIAVESLKAKITLVRLYFFGCILSVFLTSRYSILVVIFVVSLYVIYLISKSVMGFWLKILSLFLYALPLFVSITTVYFHALRIQNPGIEQLDYQGYLINNWTLLFWPFRNFIYLVILFFLILLLAISIKNKYSVIKKYQALLSTSVTINLLFIVISFLGKYMWVPFLKWGLPYFITVLLCLVALLGEMLVRIIKRPSIFKYTFLLVVLILSLYINKDSVLARTYQAEIFERYPPLLSCMNDIDFAKYNKIYVDWWASPSIRYLFEYGALKQSRSGNYPEKFTFGTGGLHTAPYIPWHDFLLTQPRMNSLLQYDLMITPEIVNWGESDQWVLIDGCEEGVYIKK